MSGRGSKEHPSGDVPVEQQWGIGRAWGIVMCLPVVGMAIWTVTHWTTWPISDTWPAFLIASSVAFAGVHARWSVRLTRDELLIRYPVGGQRIARAEVESAQFIYWGLVIRKRDGRFAFAFLAPKWSSTELSSGGRPGPDSAAYRITQWATQSTPSDD